MENNHSPLKKLVSISNSCLYSILHTPRVKITCGTQKETLSCQLWMPQVPSPFTDTVTNPSPGQKIQGVDKSLHTPDRQTDRQTVQCSNKYTTAPWLRSSGPSGPPQPTAGDSGRGLAKDHRPWDSAVCAPPSAGSLGGWLVGKRRSQGRDACVHWEGSSRNSASSLGLGCNSTILILHLYSSFRPYC